MKLARVFVLFVVLMALPRDTFAATVAHGDWIKSIAFAANRLWLVDNDRNLFSLSEDEADARPETAAGTVFGLCVSKGHATVISKPTAKSDYVVRRYKEKGWETITELKTTREILAFACDDERIIVISRDKSTSVLFENVQFLSLFKNGKTDEFELNGGLHVGEATTFIRGDDLYVGLNAGEWGGGLQRVNLTTALLESINKLDSRDACRGPLYAECDPVTAISDLPGRPDCVSIAIGLQHKDMDNGRLLSVCDHKVERLYERPRIASPFYPEGPSIVQELPFYGLSRIGPTLYATGTDGLYQRDAATGEIRHLGMPTFRRYGPFTVSFATHELVLVMGYLGGDYPVGSIPILLTSRP